MCVRCNHTCWENRTSTFRAKASTSLFENEKGCVEVSIQLEVLIVLMNQIN
jgi:hypothetical protein